MDKNNPPATNRVNRPSPWKSLCPPWPKSVIIHACLRWVKINQTFHIFWRAKSLCTGLFAWSSAGSCIYTFCAIWYLCDLHPWYPLTDLSRSRVSWNIEEEWNRAHQSSSRSVNRLSRPALCCSAGCVASGMSVCVSGLSAANTVWASCSA